MLRCFFVVLFVVEIAFLNGFCLCCNALKCQNFVLVETLKCRDFDLFDLVGV